MCGKKTMRNAKKLAARGWKPQNSAAARLPAGLAPKRRMIALAEKILRRGHFD